jgi:hypothetical protein
LFPRRRSAHLSVHKLSYFYPITVGGSPFESLAGGLESMS